MQIRLENKIKMDFEVDRMEPLFASEADYQAFINRHEKHQVPIRDLASYRGKHSSESMPVPPPPKPLS